MVAGCSYSVLFYKVNWWTFRIIPGPPFQHYVRTLCMLLNKRIAFFTTANRNLVLLWLRFFLGEQKKYIYPEESLLLTNENSRESYTNLQYLKYEIKMSTIYTYTLSRQKSHFIHTYYILFLQVQFFGQSLNGSKYPDPNHWSPVI